MYVEIYRRVEDWLASIHINGRVELRSVDFLLDIDELCFTPVLSKTPSMNHQPGRGIHIR